MALNDAVQSLLDRQLLEENPIKCQVGAISVGVYRNTPILDLDYAEDCCAETDMNVVMDSSGGFIEIQGTAEAAPFTQEHLHQMLDLAKEGINHIFVVQQS